MAEQMFKITLVDSTKEKKKEVILRQLKISHTEQAAQGVSGRSNGDANLMQLLMQKELLKLLLYQVDGVVITANEKEQMDNLFSVKEYAQLLKVIGKINGGDEKEEDPKIEFLSIGDK